MPTEPRDFLDELKWRGLVHQCTDEDGLRAHLTGTSRSLYAGFDPTADSLTIGNLVPIMLLAHAKRAGHTPVVVMGGGTGLIGDPSGKSDERQLMTADRVQANVDAQRPIYDAVLGAVEGPAHQLVDNADWLCKLSYIEALRDIGKHFSVNMMMAKESVRSRLADRDHGISYTEFSYMILQAYDFLHLYKDMGVTVQLGGSDQYGNIVAGLDLIRRERSTRFVRMASWYEQEMTNALGDEIELTKDLHKSLRKFRKALDNMKESLQPDAFGYDILVDILEESYHKFNISGVLHANPNGQETEVAKKVKDFQLDNFTESSFGLTAPLVQKADGGKFGKTESGAVWLTSARTSPYAYFQFWLNASDDDVIPFLKTFTFLTQQEIQDLESAHNDNPGRREAQRTLAREATTILHGQAEADNAEAAGKALFSGDLAALDERTLREVFAEVPSSEIDRADLDAGYDPVALLTATKLAKSNREAREFIANGSVSVNGRKLGPSDTLTATDLLHGSLTAIRRGKKTWHLVRWS